jgi:hypothetical protein
VTNLDELLIQRVYSPLTGWFQHRLGLGQWRIATECLNGHVAFYLAGFAFAISSKGMRDGIFTDLLSALAWLAIMEFVRRVALRQAGSSMGAQTARFAERHFRFIFLLMLSVSLFYLRGWSSACYTASLLLLLSHLYFKASDTPPRRPRRSLARAGA